MSAVPNILARRRAAEDQGRLEFANAPSPTSPQSRPPAVHTLLPVVTPIAPCHRSVGQVERHTAALPGAGDERQGGRRREGGTGGARWCVRAPAVLRPVLLYDGPARQDASFLLAFSGRTKARAECSTAERTVHRGERARKSRKRSVSFAARLAAGGPALVSVAARARRENPGRNASSDELDALRRAGGGGQALSPLCARRSPLLLSLSLFTLRFKGTLRACLLQLLEPQRQPGTWSTKTSPHSLPPAAAAKWGSVMRPQRPRSSAGRQAQLPRALVDRPQGAHIRSRHSGGHAHGCLVVRHAGKHPRPRPLPPLPAAAPPRPTPSRAPPRPPRPSSSSSLTAASTALPRRATHAPSSSSRPTCSSPGHQRRSRTSNTRGGTRGGGRSRRR